jgi:hypothetical protein
MKTTRILSFFLSIGAAAVAFAADPTGTWKWTVQSPNGAIDTTLKLESKDGKLTGAYSNEYGEAAISDASCKDDQIAFDVVREFGGNAFVLKYRGKIEGDGIKGTIETPGFGGDTQKLEWNAKRVDAVQVKRNS